MDGVRVEAAELSFKNCGCQPISMRMRKINQLKIL